MTKTLLVRSSNRSLLSRAVEAGFTDLLLDRPIDGLGRVNAYRIIDGDVHLDGKHVGHYVRIEDREDELRVRRMKGKVPIVIVEPKNWKVIPLENLVAALGGKTKLFAVARDAAEAKLFLGTLEKGVDGVVLSPGSVKDLESYRPLLAAPTAPAQLAPATVTRIEPLGMGERVCVDTVNLFEPGEGLLIGSASHGFFLVSAECFESEYVAARPFRVNAGAVHSYVWTGEKTKYLSEVRSGTPLEAVDAQGNRRTVTVGRAKIETRPLLLIEASTGRGKASVILQNAETVRLVQAGGRTKSVARLKVGDKVLFHRESGARHFGMKIEERIKEV